MPTPIMAQNSRLMRSPFVGGRVSVTAQVRWYHVEGMGAGVLLSDNVRGEYACRIS